MTSDFVKSYEYVLGVSKTALVFSRSETEKAYREGLKAGRDEVMAVWREKYKSCSSIECDDKFPGLKQLTFSDDKELGNDELNMMIEQWR